MRTIERSAKEGRAVNGRNIISAGKVLFVLSVLLLGAGPALAYVGPGAGLEFVGYFMSLLVWAGVAFSAVLLWPFYALVRRIRGGKREPKNPPTPAVQGPEVAGEDSHASP
jgi:hypothetical protein